jgi:hypothetical protein
MKHSIMRPTTRLESIEKHAMRVSPEEPRSDDTRQFITKTNDRAFIYTPNFGTYDGQENLELKSA